MVTVQTTLKKLRRIDPEQKLIIDAYNELWPQQYEKDVIEKTCLTIGYVVVAQTETPVHVTGR